MSCYRLTPSFHIGVTDTVMMDERNIDMPYLVILGCDISQLVGVSGLEIC